MTAGLVPLKLGDAAAHVPVTGTSREIGLARAAAIVEPEQPTKLPGLSVEPEDATLIAKRARLKAQACAQLASVRASGVDAAQAGEHVEMDSLRAKAKELPACGLWMLSREAGAMSDAQLTTLGHGFTALAEALELASRLVKSQPEHRSELESALHLLAEADSALRIAARPGSPKVDDHDQEAAHLWLKRQTAEQQIFVSRYMRLSDPADPARFTGIITDVVELRDRIEQEQHAKKSVEKLVNQVRYHAKRLPPEGQLDEHDARKIDSAITALAEFGVRPGSERVRSALGSVRLSLWPIESVPPSEQTRRALRNLEQDETDADDESSPSKEYSQTVAVVRSGLAGKRVVLIGGQRKPEAEDRIREAFELGELEWVRLEEHGTGVPMEAPITSPSTALVLVIIKLTGHLHAEQARSLAKATGKPCVYLTGGYSPEQIALATLEQAGVALGLVDEPRTAESA